MSRNQRVISEGSVRELISQFEIRDTSAAPPNSSGELTFVESNHGRKARTQNPAISLNNETPPSLHMLGRREIENIMASPYPNLAASHPRVGMTPSMLYAYAHVRGLAELRTDPVYQALFPGASREIFTQRVQIPRINGIRSMEAFHKGAKFFYDTLTDIEEPPTEPLTHREPPATIDLSYDDYMTNFKPTVGRNHSKGAEVYNNFGYIDADGNWADPDSIGSMNDASLLVENDTSSLQFTNNLPVLPKRHKGPRIMTGDELDEFYDGYVSEVSDEFDGEGDPRRHQISTGTFARLVQGAVRGDGFAENILDPAIYKPRKRAEHGRVTAPLTSPEPQYDLIDGDLISGIRTDDSNPSLQESPRGVNLTLTPNQFTYLHPLVARNLPREAFTAHTGQQTELVQPSSVPSSTTYPLIVTESLAVGELGEERFTTATAEIEAQRARLDTLRNDNLARQYTRNESRHQRCLLKRELFFLQKALVEKREAMAKAREDEKVEMAVAALVVSDSGSGSGSGFGHNRLRRRGQIQRYLDEERQALVVGIWHEENAEKRLKGEIEELTIEVENVESAKEKVCALLEGDGDDKGDE